MGLKGNVKQVKKRSYFARLDSGIIVPGKVYRGIHFREDYTASFNSNGLITSWTGMDADKTTEEQWSKEYRYDSLGRIRKLCFGSRPVFIYCYDSLSGKLHSVIHPGNQKSLDLPESKECFFYDKKGKLIKKTRTDYHSGTETWTRTFHYTYDAKGRLVKESGTFTNSDSVSEYTSCIYKNNETLMTYTSREPKSPEYLQKLDSNGRLVEYREKFSGEKSFSNVTSYTYNANNDVLTEKQYLHGKITSTVSYQYDYDANANWIKMIVFLNDQPHCIHLREISYY